MDETNVEQLRALRTLVEVFSFLFGLCVGSFLNVVIARVPEGLSIVRPPSRCPRCLKQIAWYDNIPVVSWLVLRGKCRGCGLPISVRYPTVELLVGLLAFSLARTYGLDPRTFFYFVFVALLVAITYIDLDHWIIPHVLTWPGIVVAVGASFVNPDVTPQDALIGAVAGFGVFALVALVGAKLFGKEALGQGDWWLLGMIGAFLGWKALLPVILLASLQGSIIGVALILLGRAESGEKPAEEAAAAPPAAEPPVAQTPVKEGESEEEDEDWVPPKYAVPFGPFLSLAALEQLFLGDWLRGIYERILQHFIV